MSETGRPFEASSHNDSRKLLNAGSESGANHSWLGSAVDLVKRGVCIPIRKTLREWAGHPDVSRPVDGIAFGSFPRSQRVWSSLRSAHRGATVVDLRSPEERARTSSPEGVVWLPTTDGRPLSDEVVHSLASLRKGTPERDVLIFCRAGRNRSALAAATLLAFERNLDAAAAVSLVARSRRFVRILPEQLAWLAALRAHCPGDRGEAGSD